MSSRALRLLLALALWLSLVAAAPALADPPGRVARLAFTEGMVMLHNRTLGHWDAATVNWPLTGGDSLHTGADGRAEIRVGSSALRLNADTEVRIERLDDQHIHVWLEHGSVALRLRSRDPADHVTLETRDGRALAREPGRYRLDYAHATTTLTAERGRIEFLADDRRLIVAEGQRAAIWFAGGTQYSIGAAREDGFSEWVRARDRADDALGAPRYVSPEMTGAEDLARYGDWHHTPSYGHVWYPRHVPVGWVPYRHGRWVWVDPWGWTWIDQAPWGFAPFHYGRWVLIGSRWAWVPGTYVARPVYAPALVMWIGSPGWSVSFSFGHLPAIGWFPLGPRDVFVPHFRASPAYVHKVNITHVTSITHITQVVREPQRGRFAFRDHRDAVTVVPVDTVVRGRPVARSILAEPQRWTRDVQVATRGPEYPRRDWQPQAREHSLRFDEQRRRRLADDEARRAERLRAFESGARRYGLQAAPAQRNGTHSERGPWSGRGASAEQIPDAAQPRWTPSAPPRPRPQEAAPRTPARDAARSARESPSLPARSALQRNETPRHGPTPPSAGALRRGDAIRSGDAWQRPGGQAVRPGASTSERRAWSGSTDDQPHGRASTRRDEARAPRPAHPAQTPVLPGSSPAVTETGRRQWSGQSDARPRWSADPARGDVVPRAGEGRAGRSGEGRSARDGRGRDFRATQ